jgi:hypothetical protein
VTIKKKIVLVLIFCVSDTIIAFARFGQFFFLLHQCSYAGIYSDRIGAVLVGLVMHAARCFFFLASEKNGYCWRFRHCHTLTPPQSVSNSW